MIAEYTFVTGTNTLRSLNVWGQGLLWTDRQGTKRYHHFDGDGSTRALTDSSQNVTETYEYTSFGELIAATGATVNPFRWMGAVGTYDDGARGSAQSLFLMYSSFGSPLLGIRMVEGGSTCSLPRDDVHIERRAVCACLPMVYGKLKIDCSCAGVGVWLKFEDENRWGSARCNVVYKTDGISINGVIIKYTEARAWTLNAQQGVFASRIAYLSLVT